VPFWGQPLRQLPDQKWQIGEAVKRMSPEFRAAQPGVPWKLVAGTDPL
jgi:hypothetical protein